MHKLNITQLIFVSFCLAISSYLLWQDQTNNYQCLQYGANIAAYDYNGKPIKSSTHPYYCTGTSCFSTICDHLMNDSGIDYVKVMPKLWPWNIKLVEKVSAITILLIVQIIVLITTIIVNMINILTHG